MVLAAALTPWLLGGPSTQSWRRAGLGALACVAGFAAGVLAERLSYRAMLGDTPRSTVMGINLIAKTPFILVRGDLATGAAAPGERPLLQKIEALLLADAKLARDAEAALSRRDARQFVTNFLEFEFQMRGGSEALLKTVSELSARRGQPPSTVATSLSLRIISKRPWRFLERVAGNFVRFIWLAEFPSPAGIAEARACPPAWALPDGGRRWCRDMTPPLMPRSPIAGRPGAVRMAHVTALLAFGTGLLLALRALFRRRKPSAPLSPLWAFALVAGLGFVGYLLGCAIAINVQVRYLMTIWPLTVLLGSLLLFAPVAVLDRATDAAADG